MSEKKINIYTAMDTIINKAIKFNENPNALFTSDCNHYCYFPVYTNKLDKAKNVFNFTGDKLMSISTKNELLKSKIARFLSEYHFDAGYEPGTTEINKIISRMMAFADDNKQELYNRIAYHDNKIFYDIHKDSQVIEISKAGWEPKRNRDLLFTNWNHQKAQVMPDRNGDAFKLLEHLNIQNENNKILYLVRTIAAFLPHIQQPILQLFGPYGCGKSTAAYCGNDLVDPSSGNDGYEIKKDDDLIQNLYHHYYSNFDNVSYISQTQSDYIARSVTGLSGEKRKLYTDGDDINYSFKRAVTINGLHPVAIKSDVLDRSILIGFEKITEGKGELEIKQDFLNDKPEIFGGVLDTLVETLKRIDSIDIELDYRIRLRDFARYGFVIADVLGIGGEKFLKAYTDTFENRDLEAIQSSIVGSLVLEYLNEHGTFKGTPLELMTKIEHMMKSRSLKMPQFFPKNPNSFGASLTDLRQNFQNIGFDFYKKRKNFGICYLINNNKFEPLETEATTRPHINVPKIFTDGSGCVSSV